VHVAGFAVVDAVLVVRDENNAFGASSCNNMELNDQSNTELQAGQDG
jgi:hypothetical protein